MHEHLRARYARAVIKSFLRSDATMIRLLIRWFVGGFFLMSGINSLLDWPLTLAFFQVKHELSWISPLAALLSTAAELALPILLVLGLLPSFATTGLLVINAAAMFWFGPMSDAQSTGGFEARMVMELLLLLKLSLEPGGLKLRSFFGVLRPRP